MRSPIHVFVVFIVFTAGPRLAYAHHPVDIESELSLWHFVAIAVPVFLVFFGATAIKKLLRRRHDYRPTSRK